MKKAVTFDESSWNLLEPLLPHSAAVREVILDDFMWFMRRNKKYKSNCEKVEDYVRHLQLKANPVFDLRPNISQAFRCLDIKAVDDCLVEYVK